jgi:hypothetical protein
MRASGLVFFGSLLVAIAASCGGKMDGGTDGGGTDGGGDANTDSPACQPLGGACKVSVDCCYGFCAGGQCATTPPSCSPDFAKCASSSQCCSGLCDPQAGYCQPGGPPPPCEPDGAACSSSGQCCSFACVGGSCAPAPPPPCNPDGAPCSVSGDCCSLVCGGNVCGGTVVDGGIGCGTTSNKQCDQCVAGFCCQQMSACESNTQCSSWLSCVQGCEQKGYSAFWCTQNACGGPSTPMGSALYSCAQTNCGAQCTKD